MHLFLSFLWPAAIAGLLNVILPVTVHADTALQKRIESLAAVKSIGDAHLASWDALLKLYGRRAYRPIWADDTSVAALREGVETSWFDGLKPEDFHADRLFGGPGRASAELPAVDREILMSDALLRLLYQLYFGKVDPNGLDANWNYERPLLATDPIEVVAAALESEGVARLIDRARLKHPYYLGLKATLQAYVDYAVRGGWKVIPAGPATKPGERDPRLPAVRARLAVTGDYDPAATSSEPDAYDASLIEAVRAFQSRNGLEDDGVLGSKTIEAMNVTADARVEQIRVNLERARWVLRTLDDDPDAIIVNIPGFYLAVRSGGKTVWRTDVVVGRTYSKTPVFTAPMRYVVINPDWTVPRGIATSEILPKVQADPGYLDAHDYEVREASGRRVDPSSIAWSSLSRAAFPFTIVQRPGPRNALGLVKFMFPNRHNVYLHDTPSRNLFSKADRTFSHGCIRVKDPLRLAEIVLGEREGWTPSAIKAAVGENKLRQVNLSKPIPVMILYWTVDPNFNGTARFYRDVYGRDERLLKALNAPFKRQST